jgi:NAD(P)-dependent dehydrogenase (short-subunit alcohol dehydrogenase family)
MAASIASDKSLKEIAPAALFLAADESSYVRGNDLIVDRGATAI